MADYAASRVATQMCTLVAIGILTEPYDKYNEGQKVLIAEYTDLEVDVQINVDLDFPFYTIDLSSFYMDIECPHEEAFGDLFDDTKDLVEYFAEEVFNVEGIVFDDYFFDNLERTLDTISTRISVFA